MPSKFATNKEIDYTIPKGRMPGFWSFSRLSVFEGCPLRYSLQYIWKLEQPPSRAMERGLDIHKKSEQYLLGNTRGIPDELMQFREEYAALRKLDTVTPEESYTVTKTWQVTHAKDWDNAWLRAKVDIEVLDEVITVIDVKSGRKRDSHEIQAEIYGTLAFVVHPEAQKLDFEFWYVDSGEVGEFKFERGDLRKKKQEWKRRSNKMLNAKSFKATPAKGYEGCDYCPFRSDKKLKGGVNGPCHAWKEA